MATSPRLRPLSRFVLLADDPDETVENGVTVRLPESGWRTHMDYTVVMVGKKESPEFGPGDRVVIRHPNAGRMLRWRGIPHRLVRVDDIIAVVDPS